jgi:putative transposase
MRYRRAKVDGGTFFFTLVTYERRDLFQVPENLALLRQALGTVMQSHPLRVDAIVVLPDHLHCIWTLPGGDHDFSKRWRLIKSHVSIRAFTASFGRACIRKPGARARAWNLMTRSGMSDGRGKSLGFVPQPNLLTWEHPSK